MKVPTSELRKKHRYDPLTGELTHATQHNHIRIGDRVGSLNGGYLTTRLHNVSLKVHRIIYQMHHGDFDESLEIDHIDGNRRNNRIENLRAVTKHVNQLNKSLPSTNGSGVIGVSWSKPHRKWRAQIKYRQTNIYLGLFARKADAIRARKKAEMDFGFHANHGRVVQ